MKMGNIPIQCQYSFLGPRLMKQLFFSCVDRLKNVQHEIEDKHNKKIIHLQ